MQIKEERADEGKEEKAGAGPCLVRIIFLLERIGSKSRSYAGIVKEHFLGLTKADFVDMHHIKHMEVMPDFEHPKRPVYHAGYVEFKDMSIIAYTLFDKAVVENYKAGERIQIESKWYRVISRTPQRRDGKIYQRINLKAENPVDVYFDLFWLGETDEGYVLYGYSDDIVSQKKIYKGSFYIKLDAKVAYFDMGAKVVTMEEYLRLFGEDSLIYGYFNMEDDGMISDLYMIIAG